MRHEALEKQMLLAMQGQSEKSGSGLNVCVRLKFSSFMEKNSKPDVATGLKALELKITIGCSY